MIHPKNWSMDEIKEAVFVLTTTSIALALLFVMSWLAYIVGL